MNGNLPKMNEFQGLHWIGLTCLTRGKGVRPLCLAGA